jgi:cytochrome c oxidase subunit 1
VVDRNTVTDDFIPRIRSERPAFDLHHPQATPIDPSSATVATVMSTASDGALADATGNP